MSLVSDNPDIEIVYTYKGSEDSAAVSVAGIPWMSATSVLVIKLRPGKIQVWEVNRMTNVWSLYAESTILNSTKLANENSGQSMKSTPTSSPDISTDLPTITLSASK
jgi:hypothetical protein